MERASRRWINEQESIRRFNDDLGRRMSKLPVKSQSLLLASAAEALAGGASANSTVLAINRLCQEIYRHCSSRDDYMPHNILAEVARLQTDTPEGEEGNRISDAVICADFAARIPSGELSAKDGVWYIIETELEELSEASFGFSDVGSEDENLAESEILATPDGKELINVLSSLLSRLKDVKVPDAHDVGHTRSRMRILS